MDLLSKAKEFLARKASKLAMAAVPLAVLAVTTPAKATTLILDPNGTDNCYAQANGTCVLSTSPTGGSTFMNQLILTGSATAASGGFANLSNSGSGTTNGAILPAGSIPVSWVFQVTGNSGQVEWSVEFELEGALNNYFFSQSGSTSGGMVTGSGAIVLGSSDTINGYDIEVDTNGTGSYSLSAPLNLNASLSSAPEPTSLLLMGAGGAALLALKRRKKQA